MTKDRVIPLGVNVVELALADGTVTLTNLLKPFWPCSPRCGRSSSRPASPGEPRAGSADGARSGRGSEPLAPGLVVEVGYDHFTGGRFRHGTHFLRWRPDKAARRCTLDQVKAAAASASLLPSRAVTGSRAT